MALLRPSKPPTIGGASGFGNESGGNVVVVVDATESGTIKGLHGQFANLPQIREPREMVVSPKAQLIIEWDTGPFYWASLLLLFNRLSAHCKY